MSQLFEGLEAGDLARLVTPEIGIDEFKSKMGADSDVIVLNFTVGDKFPAIDLMNFIERGYDWVLDADASAGELSDGRYMVFVELARDKAASEQIDNLISNICNLTKQECNEWKFKYRKDKRVHDLSQENIEIFVPLTPESYRKKYDREEIERMQSAANIPVKNTAPVNDFTESLRVAAGLK